MRRKGGIPVDMSNELYDQTHAALDELLARAVKPFYAPRLVVVGCSSSEALGGLIGHDSSPEAGLAMARAALDSANAHGCALAAQCCEHLNRALVVERECAERMGYQIVWAVPKPKAGGSFATGLWGLLRDPVLVEQVSADAGLDIGDTLIGMHLKRVAVPVRLEHCKIGQAHVTAALCRPPLIGGARAHYE